jgi:hypothetical protein
MSTPVEPIVMLLRSIRRWVWMSRAERDDANRETEAKIRARIRQNRRNTCCGKPCNETGYCDDCVGG